MNNFTWYRFFSFMIIWLGGCLLTNLMIRENLTIFNLKFWIIDLIIIIICLPIANLLIDKDNKCQR